MHMMVNQVFICKKLVSQVQIQMEMENSSPLRKHQLVKSMTKPNLLNHRFPDRQYLH